MNRTFIFIALCVIAFVASIMLFEFGNKKIEKIPIRIATNPWPGFELLHLADEKGFFKEEGVEVKLVRFSAREDARRAFERGQVDGMTSALTELLTAHEHGRLAQILLITDFSNGADIIVAQKGINNLADLKNKKVAVEFESFGTVLITRALEKVDLSINDIKIKGINQLNIPNALLTGEIDAAHTYPPYSTELMKHKDKVIKLMDSSEIPNKIIDILSIDSDIVLHRTEDMKAIRRAWDKAVIYAREHPQEANKFMAEIEGISQIDFVDALAGTKILSLAEQQPLMTHDGVVEHVLVQVNDLLYKGKPVQKPIQVDNYISHTEDDEEWAR